MVLLGFVSCIVFFDLNFLLGLLVGCSFAAFSFAGSYRCCCGVCSDACVGGLIVMA